MRASEEALRLSPDALDAAILKAYQEGQDPVLLMLPTARALHAAALAGDVGAIREELDRVSGKVAQEIIADEESLEESLEAVLERISERRKALLTAAPRIERLVGSGEPE